MFNVASLISNTSPELGFVNYVILNAYAVLFIFATKLFTSSAFALISIKSNVYVVLGALYVLIPKYLVLLVSKLVAAAERSNKNFFVPNYMIALLLFDIIKLGFAFVLEYWYVCINKLFRYVSHLFDA